MLQAGMIQLDTKNLREQAKTLKAGDQVLLSGEIYAIFDQAHKVLHGCLTERKPLPFSLDGITIYYTSPSPTPKGKVIGSCGPTTSSRLDIFTTELLDAGVVCTIGKGERSQDVYDAIARNHAVYLTAIGGTGALLSHYVEKVELFALLELGLESCVKKLTVENFPLMVAVDCSGNTIFQSARQRYRRL